MLPRFLIYVGEEEGSDPLMLFYCLVIKSNVLFSYSTRLWVACAVLRMVTMEVSKSFSLSFIVKLNNLF